MTLSVMVALAGIVVFLGGRILARAEDRREMNAALRGQYAPSRAFGMRAEKCVLYGNIASVAGFFIFASIVFVIPA